MKEEKIPCRIIRYREFPDLLFGTLREDGPVYFDATRFIQAKGDARRHNVRDFRVAFHHWATALADAYGIDREKMIIRDEASGHLLIDECLALLFVVYIRVRCLPSGARGRTAVRWIYGFRHLAGTGCRS